jgi:hypothetical protein
VGKPPSGNAKTYKIKKGRKKKKKKKRKEERKKTLKRDRKRKGREYVPFLGVEELVEIAGTRTTFDALAKFQLNSALVMYVHLLLGARKGQGGY